MPITAFVCYLNSLIEQIASNKSSLLLKMQKAKHTSFTNIYRDNKTESIYESNLNAKLEGLVDETMWSY
jgi:hypothetical protein